MEEALDLSFDRLLMMMMMIFCHTNVIRNFLKRGNALWELTADLALRTRYIMRALRENQERLKANIHTYL